jgi:HAD superfamily hydrolase (TIGR01509 family)
VPRFDAILFDFDGVLLDSEPVHWACWREVLLPLGVSLEWEHYRDHCIGIDDRLMLQSMAGDARDWRELWAQYPAKKELFQAKMIAAPPFPEGLGEFLEQLRGSYRMAIVSSSACDEIEPLLERAGLRSCFETIVGGGDVEHHKPAPEPYLLAAKRLNARAPLVLEDSQAGIASARAAGFAVLEIRHPDEVQARLGEALEAD